MNYPIYITNMNRLTTTKGMVESLYKLNPRANIIIIDNASTYPPLLDWYNEVKNDIRIISNPENRGPWSFFYTGHHLECDQDYYIYTDADLELNPNMPSHWQEIMYDIIEKYQKKASLALKIDDLPDNEITKRILTHQSVCWYPTDERHMYYADSDMTFCMDKKKEGYRYPSIRMAGDFECRHLPWYLDMYNLPEEEKYYLDHMDTAYLDAAMWTKANLEKYKLINE